MEYLDILTVILGVALLGSVVFLSHRQAQEQETIEKTLSKLAKNFDTPSPTSPEIAGRMAQLERRMEVLEGDVKGYLAKANTRLARAKKLANKHEEDEETEEDARMYEQIPIPGIDSPDTGQNGPTVWSEDEQLEQVKAAMRQHR